MEWEPLIAAAVAARSRAYAPYSGFLVGAAVLAADGTIHAGCNIENSSFGATTCAERVAIGAMIAAGPKRIRAIAVVSETEPPAPPCGLCLQVLTEFGESETPVLLLNPAGKREQLRLGDLSPRPFVVPPQGLGRRSG